MWRIILKPWIHLLALVLASGAFLALTAHLPNNPRHGWSTVGVLLHGYNRGAPPGTPLVYGDFVATIHAEGDALFALQPPERFRREVPPRVLAVADYRVERLRRGVFHPTRQTVTRVVAFRAPAHTPPLTAEQEKAAVDALMHMHRRLIDEHPTTWATYAIDLPAELQLYADGHVSTGPTPIPGAFAANLPFYVLIAIMLLTLPGSVMAALATGRRVLVTVRRRADHRPRCPGCAYDLTGLSAQQCPECGRPIPPSPIAPPPEA